MKKKNLLALLLVIQMLIVLVTGCGSKTPSAPSSPSSSSTSTSVSSSSNSSSPDAESATSADDTGAVSGIVDTKFVSKNYMLTTLTNKDCTITEADSGLTFNTQNAILYITLIPGVQNLTSATSYMQSLVPTYFTDGQAGDITDGYLFGYRAKLYQFSCTTDSTPCEGLTVVSIINQSLYTLNLLITDQTTEEEFALMQNIISGMVVLQPTAVDNTAHTATYTDPYANYTTYYDDIDYYDIATWYYLPYECYSWCEIDYSTWSDVTLFEPDWNYYSTEDTYWDWSWDSEEDWVFYDDYSEYYEEEYYEAQEDYYSDYDYESYDVWQEEDFSYYDDSSYDDDSYDDDSY